MLSLIPEYVIASAFQLVCYSVAMLTVVFSFFMVPRA